jgi:DNA-binding CsgD family transcriptional regulator
VIEADWDQRLQSDPSYDGLIAALKRIEKAAFLVDPRLPDSPIVAANGAFFELTGRRPDEIIGRNAILLTEPQADARPVKRNRYGQREALPVLIELGAYRRNGVPVRHALKVSPCFNEEGRLIYFHAKVDQEISGSMLKRRIRASEAVYALTERQGQVLALIAAGFQTKKIATALDISERTVKMHRAAMMKTLKAQTTAEVIRIAVEAGL